MGQSPPRMRKSDDLPVPLPPTTSRWFCREEMVSLQPRSCVTASGTEQCGPVARRARGGRTYPGLDVEAQAVDEDVACSRKTISVCERGRARERRRTVRRDDGHLVEDDLVVRVDDLAAALKNCEASSSMSVLTHHRTAERDDEAEQPQRGGRRSDALLAFSATSSPLPTVLPAVLPPPTSFFWYLPCLTSSIVSRSSETRAV